MLTLPPKQPCWFSNFKEAPDALAIRILMVTEFYLLSVRIALNISTAILTALISRLSSEFSVLSQMFLISVTQFSVVFQSHLSVKLPIAQRILSRGMTSPLQMAPAAPEIFVWGVFES